MELMDSPRESFRAEAVTTEGNILLTWDWPDGCERMLIIYAWRRPNGRYFDPSVEETGGLCRKLYKKEYYSAGGFVHRIGPRDYGTLTFILLPVPDNPQNDYRRWLPDSEEAFDELAVQVAVPGREVMVDWSVRYRKFPFSGYQLATLEIRTPAEIPTGGLAYRVTSSNIRYPVVKSLKVGTARIRDIILGRGDGLYLEAVPGSVYRLNHV